VSQRALAAVDGRVLGPPRNVPNALVGSGGLWHALTPRGRASGGLFTGCALSVANHGLEFLPAIVE
jgi:hypothetical protein